jgi:4-hydroxy-2-oxovalerate aldolase
VISLVDTTLRDGMHSVRHRLLPDQVRDIVAGLDGAGVRTIEVGHGDGLSGSSIQYGRSAASDEALIEAAVSAASEANIAVLLLPGIGTLHDLKNAQALGASVARVATHCTEADIAQQHIGWARSAGMWTIGFLMMSHMIEPAKLVEQALLMESYGANVVYVVDSAGALVPRTAAERVLALRDRLEIEVGFHAHNNLGCAVGNTLAAADAGATWVDGSLCGLGAGAGNAQTEVLCAALTRGGHDCGVDLMRLLDAAEVAAPLLTRSASVDRAALLVGYAGVYSSFLLHAERASEKYDVPLGDVLLELGKRRVVGGQEDAIIDVAAELATSAGRTR